MHVHNILFLNMLCLEKTFFVRGDSLSLFRLKLGIDQK
jgi:hypothetical protein